MGYIYPIVMIAAAVIGGYSAYQSGQAQSANYKAQARNERNNAEIAQQNAQIAAAQATAREEHRRRIARQVLGEQRAAIAESGGLGGGTYIGVAQQSAANAELDALNERYAGVLQGRGMMAEASQNMFRSKLARMNAGSASTAGYLGAASNLLGGAANYAQYNQMQQQQRTGG